MNTERFLEILSDDGGGSKLGEEGCNAMKGLLIIQKYLPDSGIRGADHDIIYACDVDKLVEAGITEEDAKELQDQNWMVEDGDYLACFV